MVGCQPYAPAAFTPRKYSWYSFLLEAESTPGPHCDRKDFMSMKNPLTPAGIEPPTSWFVAQHLNHCANTVPPSLTVEHIILCKESWSHYTKYDIWKKTMLCCRTTEKEHQLNSCKCLLLKSDNLYRCDHFQKFHSCTVTLCFFRSSLSAQEHHL